MEWVSPNQVQRGRAMYLIYIDESGKPNCVDKENFVLCALIVQEHQWQPLDNQTKILKLRYFPNLNDEQVELHMKDLMAGVGVFSALDQATRKRLLLDCFSEMAKSDITIVASLIDKSRLQNRVDLELWGFRLLFERICWVLKARNGVLITNGQTPEHGLLLIDSINPEYDKKVRAKLLGPLRIGTFYMKNEYVIEDPLFVSSQWRNLSQIVDLVAWVIRRHFRPSHGSKDMLADELFRYVELKLHRDSHDNWNGPGIKIFP